MRLVFGSKSLEGDQNKKIPCPQKEDLFCFVLFCFFYSMNFLGKFSGVSRWKLYFIHFVHYGRELDFI